MTQRTALHHKNDKQAQFESAFIAEQARILGVCTENGIAQLKALWLIRESDGEYKELVARTAWWAWQSASHTTLHVVAAGICQGARVVGVYTDSVTAERVKQVALDDESSDCASVTTIVVDEIDPAIKTEMQAQAVQTTATSITSPLSDTHAHLEELALPHERTDLKRTEYSHEFHQVFASQKHHHYSSVLAIGTLKSVGVSSP